MTSAFVIVAALSAGILAVSSYLLVRADRLAAFEERAVGSAQLASALADSVVEARPDIDAASLATRLDGGRFDVVVVGGSDGSFGSTREGFEQDDLPADIPSDGAEDGFLRTRTEVGGETTLVIRPEPSSAPYALLFLFPMGGLEGEMSRLAGILAKSWAVVVLLSGVAGYAVARSTLKPVARASAAARSLAEGLLETRLPTGRHDEFGNWALSFNEMAEALQEKIEALTAAHAREKRFTSDVAHELRTPLTALVGSASLVRSSLRSLDPETRWATERMLEQVGRVKVLVEELLEIARLDSGQEEVNLQPIDLPTFLHAVVRDRPGSERVFIQADVPVFESDPRRLQRVIANLIDNAIVHGVGKVDVTAWLEGTLIHIIVEDEGEGIDARAVDQIFERFFKTDPTRRGGTGLGLAIARDNARLLGGDLQLVPGPKGARFEITLIFVPVRS